MKGSCRSGPGNANVVELMRAAGDTFLGFGGHKASGGFSVAPDAVFDLEERLAKTLASLPKEDEREAVRADAVMTPEAVSKEILKRLQTLAPFGMGNAKPSIAFHEVRLEQVSWFGKAEEHLRLTIGRGPDEFPEAPIEAMTFYAKRQLGDTCARLEKGQRISLLAHLEEDTFSRGQPIRLRIIAIG